MQYWHQPRSTHFRRISGLIVPLATVPDAAGEQMERSGSCNFRLKVECVRVGCNPLSVACVIGLRVLSSRNHPKLTIADCVAEVHDTHHPISVESYFEQQIPEATRRSEAFLTEFPAVTRG